MGGQNSICSKKFRRLIYKLGRRKKDGMTYLTNCEYVEMADVECHDTVKEVFQFNAYGQHVPGVTLREKCRIMVEGQRIGTLSDKFWRAPSKKWMAFWFKPKIWI
jgi:hypothetical protein